MGWAGRDGLVTVLAQPLIAVAAALDLRAAVGAAACDAADAALLGLQLLL